MLPEKVLKCVCIPIVSMEVFSRLVNWAKWTRTLKVYLSMCNHHGRSLASFYGTRKIGLWRNITVTWHSWVTLTCPSFLSLCVSLSASLSISRRNDFSLRRLHTYTHRHTWHSTHTESLLLSLSFSLWSLILFLTFDF